MTDFIDVVTLLERAGYTIESLMPNSYMNAKKYASMVNQARDFQIEIIEAHDNIIKIHLFEGSFPEDLSLTRIAWIYSTEEFFDTLDEDIKLQLLYYINLFV